MKYADRAQEDDGRQQLSQPDTGQQTAGSQMETYVQNWTAALHQRSATSTTAARHGIPTVQICSAQTQQGDAKETGQTTSSAAEGSIRCV